MLIKSIVEYLYCDDTDNCLPKRNLIGLLYRVHNFDDINQKIIPFF